MMLLFTTSSLALLASTALATSLEVNEAPQSPRPYVIRHLAAANAVAIGSQIYRFPVTGNSSGGAFSLVATNAPGSAALGVLPHLHQEHHENFFNVKGRFQLWAQQDGEQQSRILTSGDYGAVPSGTNHTFQILDPDTELSGVIVPGGFEKLFLTLGTPWTSPTPTAYVPAVDNSTQNSGSDPSVIESLKAFDVYAQLAFEPRRDLVDGAAPAGSIWHNGFNPLANDTRTPYFVARDHGPKTLSREGGFQIVQPLVTQQAAGEAHPFSMATVSVGRAFGDVRDWTLDGAAAMEVLEGAVTVRIAGYAPSTLYTGDVAFVPAGTGFGYWSEAAFSKFLFVGAGNNSLDRQLSEEGESWGFPVFPVEYS